MSVGVLALQGDFFKHAEMMKSLGISIVEVRKPADLAKCNGLILPGGESSVMARLIDFIGLRDSLLAFAKQRPVFGTCAGLILMSSSVTCSSLQPLNLLDVTIERNAYGRQIASFEDTISLNLDKGSDPQVFPGFFIRAPRIKALNNVLILGTYKEKPVLVRQGLHLGAAFHPELTNNPVIHQYFIQMIRESIL